METLRSLENDLRFADQRHPVDFIEPHPPTAAEDQLQRICEVLSRTFGWVAQATTVEQKGLRASVVLYCVRADLLGAATLEELGATVGTPQAVVDELVSDFCHSIGWE
ncbi:MAG: hypothetical protein SFU53_11395 [Terrimicrobiaceae bacterium]|nr:hypothetical protein [Terrimicrobiaceae bacterium]